MSNWPSRAEWAEPKRHPYWDSETGCPFAAKYSHRLSVATPEESPLLLSGWKIFGASTVAKCGSSILRGRYLRPRDVASHR